MCLTSDFESGIRIPGTSSGFLDLSAPGELGQGRLRYLTGGTGTPLVLLHTVRTQAEHFRHLIPLVQNRYTVYALDLPGMGYLRNCTKRLLRGSWHARCRHESHYTT
jgi:pimeloyl-ACP methyl ester carboxylesterase